MRLILKAAMMLAASAMLIMPQAGIPANAQSTAVPGPSLEYFAPGNILPGSNLGVQGRKVVFPDWVFPLKIGSASGHHAYIGTQLTQFHGVNWVNDPRLFNYPSRDNQCEPRQWDMRPCPAGQGHQGVDIRANDNRDDFWPVVAVESGVVTSITRNTTVQIRSGNHTVRYLHMSPDSIADAGLEIGKNVSQGQQIGRVSCFLGKICQTSRHLHFDAYSGSAGQGNFFHVYPSLIAAYKRAWDVPDGVANGELTVDPAHEVGSAGSGPGLLPDPGPAPMSSCEGVAIADPLPNVDRNSFVSLWRHNCSIMGLVADNASGERSFVYFRPKKAIEEIVADDPVLFKGVNRGGEYRGTAKQYSKRCGSQDFAVRGSAADGLTTSVKVAGTRNRLDSDCQIVGTQEQALEFVFVESVAPQPAVVQHTVPPDRETLSEITRNFLAITFYPDASGTIRLLPYFSSFPGLVQGGGKIDSAGGLIPELTTDEAGVAISRVWIRKRAQFTEGLRVTPRMVAHSMAGVDPSACDAQVNPTEAGIAAAGSANKARVMCNKVVSYLRGYIGLGGGRGFATDYFGRRVSSDELLDLGESDTSWNWMRTMYSHESGRAPVIGHEAFDRGIAMGDHYISFHYDQAADAMKPIAFYSDPCNFAQPSCGTGTGETVVVVGTGGATTTGGETSGPLLEKLFKELTILRSKVDGLSRKIDGLNISTADQDD
ncbi:M23 family metallopeptidase [Mesorhizobium sp.]|uniref:M23 family metallopeptidase n=1 Tax=Mesorhizobium sp. TaxID=1871066 RepID=UPI000FE946CB|nr:M23 family metallopeptidase [Mesorhizobium sp.]RWO88575.1 MAG: M23 family metallopeptidase [Mesorhizobium sp.]